jgi:hypothetical protein
MRYARTAAVLTWVYAAGYGLSAIPVAVYLRRRGVLPDFFDLFTMYGGRWDREVPTGTFFVLLIAFLGVTVFAAATAWLLWRGAKAGAVLNLMLLPVEAVFWFGFALPIPWLIGIARTVLVALAWESGRGRSLTSRPPQIRT